MDNIRNFDKTSEGDKTLKFALQEFDFQNMQFGFIFHLEIWTERAQM